MNKIYKILLPAFLSLFAFSACNDNDEYVVVDPVANMVKVVSRDTSFPAAPSEGKVVVESDQPVDVSCPADWLKTSVNGNVITLNADFNPSLESRSAVLTIKSGSKMSQIAVTQLGVVVDFGGLTSLAIDADTLRVVEIPMKSNCDIEFASDVDWLSIAPQDNILKITVSENQSGGIRRGNFSYKAGSVECKIPVVQYDFDKYIAGDCLLKYSNSAHTANYSKKCVVTNDSTGYHCQVALSDTEKYDIPLVFDAEKCSLKIHSAQLIGKWDGYDAFAIILGHNAENGLYNTTVKSVCLEGQVNHVVDASGNGATVASFVDNGSWSGFTAKAVYVRTFKTNPPSGTAVTTRVQFWYPELYRADK